MNQMNKKKYINKTQPVGWEGKLGGGEMAAWPGGAVSSRSRSALGTCCEVSPEVTVEQVLVAISELMGFANIM